MPPSQPLPEWSNEKILKFLELYAIENLIWDPRNKNHKLKHKVHDAWNRISVSLENTPIDDLKSKKKSLMATFRPLLKKKKASIRSGAGADDVFQPIWFAFDFMESFLGTIYDVEETINTEDMTLHSEDMPAPPPTPNQSEETVEIPLSSPSQSISSRPQKSIKTNKKARLEADEAQNKITESLETLNHVLREKRNVNDEDECDIYAKLLAKRLRKYPESMRATIMYQIDGMLLANPCPFERPLSAFSEEPSSASERPTSAYSSSKSPLHVIPQSPEPSEFYDMQPPVSDSVQQIHIPETNDTINEMDIITRAFYSASQNL